MNCSSKCLGSHCSTFQNVAEYITHWLKYSHGCIVFPPYPKFICETLTPQCVCIWRSVFREVFRINGGHKGGALIK